jgi:hypothetical protein
MASMVEQFGYEGVSSPKRAPSPRGRAQPRTKQPFLAGPVPWAWLASAAALPGRALAVGLYVWWLVGLHKGQREVEVSLSKVAREMGFGRTAATRGLAALEAAGLVKAKRKAGCKATIRVVSAG